MAQNLLYYLLLEGEVGGEIMEKRDYITENINSNNTFVSALYSELEERVQAFENQDEDSYIQRFTFSTAVLPLLFASSISVFMIYVLL